VFIDSLKNVIKATPILYNMLLPFVRGIRRRAFERNMNRFRLYCLNLPNMVSEPFFVKVGANDGITRDPVSDILLTNKSWRGLLIEPVPYCFERLKANFQDSQRFSLEQVAIGASAEAVPFYYADMKAMDSLPNLPKSFDQHGTFYKKNILKYLDGILEPFIIEDMVQVLPLSDVISRNQIHEVHLLHVDTQGHDLEVLKTLDFSKHSPLSIFVEHSHLSDSQKKDMAHLLCKHGYSVRNCGRDYFAVNKKTNMRLRLNFFRTAA